MVYLQVEVKEGEGDSLVSLFQNLKEDRDHPLISANIQPR